MNETFQIHAIGQVKTKDDKVEIKLDSKYTAGLSQIKGFSHLQVIWWAHLTDSPQDRHKLIAERLFKKVPDKLGVFGTRAPTRPNPIMISTIKVKSVDEENGIIHTPFIDAEPDTPVLDIKPYFPMERVKKCHAPIWFAHWPKWAEDAVNFNWKNEINFD